MKSDDEEHVSEGTVTAGWQEHYVIVVLSCSDKIKLDKIVAKGDEDYKELSDIRWQKIDEWSVDDAEDEQIMINYEIHSLKEGMK